MRTSGSRKRYGESPSPALYVCRDSRRPAPGITPCQAASPAVADVDARVWGVVEREINDHDLLAHVIELEKRRTGERRDWSAATEAARDRLARLERSESGVLRRYREGAISEGAIDTELAEIRRAREMARQQLTAAERAQAGIDASSGRLAVLRGGIESLRARIAAATSSEQQELVRAMIAPGGAVFKRHQVQLTLLVDLEERDTVRPSQTMVQACGSG